MTPSDPHHTRAQTLFGILEALLFATDEPLSISQLADIIGLLAAEGEVRRPSQDTLLRTIEEMNRVYDESGRAFHVVKVAGGYQFATRPEYGVWLGAMLKERSRRKLSAAALESLAVIAYKQPVTKGTTKDFLKHFGLNDLAELPKPREIDELLAEAQFEVEKRLLSELEDKELESIEGEHDGESTSERRPLYDIDAGEKSQERPPDAG